MEVLLRDDNELLVEELKETGVWLSPLLLPYVCVCERIRSMSSSSERLRFEFISNGFLGSARRFFLFVKAGANYLFYVNMV